MDAPGPFGKPRGNGFEFWDAVAALFSIEHVRRDEDKGLAARAKADGLWRARKLPVEGVWRDALQVLSRDDEFARQPRGMRPAAIEYKGQALAIARCALCYVGEHLTLVSIMPQCGPSTLGRCRSAFGSN